jgi:hypothetical protein
MDAENSPAGSAAIGDGVVYMATYNFDGDLFALALDDGSILWSKVITPTVSTPPMAALSGRRCRKMISETGGARWLTPTASSSSANPTSTISAEPLPSRPSLEMWSGAIRAADLRRPSVMESSFPSAAAESGPLAKLKLKIRRKHKEDAA